MAGVTATLATANFIKNNWKPILIIILTVILLFFVFLFGGAFIGSVTPLASPEEAQEYKDFAGKYGLDWKDMLIYDTVRLKNDFSKKNLDDTGLQFLVVKIRKYKLIEICLGKDEDGDCEGTRTERRFMNEKVYDTRDAIWNLAKVHVRYPITFAKIYSYLESIDNGAWDTDKYEYTCSIKSKDFLDAIKGFNEDEQEWAIALWEAEVPYAQHGGGEEIIGDYNLPLIPTNFTREDLIRVGSSIMGHPYLLGGKSPQKGLPKRKLDCSGFVDWAVYQLTGKTVGKGGGTASQYGNTIPISESDLKIGDLGFYYPPNKVPPKKWNHVGFYAGRINGKDVWLHCGGSTWGTPGKLTGQVVMTYNDSGYYNGFKPSRFKYFRRLPIEFADDN